MYLNVSPLYIILVYSNTFLLLLSMQLVSNIKSGTKLGQPKISRSVAVGKEMLIILLLDVNSKYPFDLYN